MVMRGSAVTVAPSSVPSGQPYTAGCCPPLTVFCVVASCPYLGKLAVVSEVGTTLVWERGSSNDAMMCG